MKNPREGSGKEAASKRSVNPLGSSEFHLLTQTHVPHSDPLPAYCLAKHSAPLV